MPYNNLNTDEAYSWIKAPRYKGQPVETGPLARILINYAAGDKAVKKLVDDTLAKLDIPLTALQSALGRTIARGLESVLIADWMREDMDQLLANIKNGNQITFNSAKWEPETWEKNAKGVGWIEAPRGALGHWIVIEDGKTKEYQAVVPSTWNASPRDKNGNIGAYEASLIGTPMADKTQPLELIRIIHSFDPCLACAVHLTDLESNTQTEIRIV